MNVQRSCHSAEPTYVRCCSPRPRPRPGRSPRLSPSPCPSCPPPCLPCRPCPSCRARCARGTSRAPPARPRRRARPLPAPRSQTGTAPRAHDRAERRPASLTHPRVIRRAPPGLGPPAFGGAGHRPDLHAARGAPPTCPFARRRPRRPRAAARRGPRGRSRGDADGAPTCGRLGRGATRQAEGGARGRDWWGGLCSRGGGGRGLLTRRAAPQRAGTKATCLCPQRAL